MLPLAREVAIPHLPQPLPTYTPAPRLVARPQYRVPIAAILLFGLAWLIAVGAAIAVLSRYATILNLSERNGRSRQELAQLGADAQSLQKQADELSSLSRIELLATTRLHMVRPKKVAIIPADPSQLAQRPAPSLASLEPPKPVAHAGFFRQLGAWWQSWRQGSALAAHR